MSKDELSSFRIGDLRRPEVRGTTRAGAKPETPEPEPAVGFPTVETWLELESVEEVADRLRPTYEALEALASAKDLKTRTSAGRAMAAYERCADLFEYLFQTKHALHHPENDG